MVTITQWSTRSEAKAWLGTETWTTQNLMQKLDVQKTNYKLAS